MTTNLSNNSTENLEKEILMEEPISKVGDKRSHQQSTIQEDDQQINVQTEQEEESSKMRSLYGGENSSSQASGNIILSPTVELVKYTEADEDKVEHMLQELKDEYDQNNSEIAAKNPGASKVELVLKGINKGFWCNRNKIKKHWEQGNLYYIKDWKYQWEEYKDEIKLPKEQYLEQINLLSGRECPQIPSFITYNPRQHHDHSIWIKKDFRRQGYGSLLIKSLKIPSVLSANEKFFKKMGYKEKKYISQQGTIMENEEFKKFYLKQKTYLSPDQVQSLYHPEGEDHLNDNLYFSIFPPDRKWSYKHYALILDECAKSEYLKQVYPLGCCEGGFGWPQTDKTTEYLKNDPPKTHSYCPRDQQIRFETYKIPGKLIAYKKEESETWNDVLKHQKGFEDLIPQEDDKDQEYVDEAGIELWTKGGISLQTIIEFIKIVQGMGYKLFETKGFNMDGQYGSQVQEYYMNQIQRTYLADGVSLSNYNEDSDHENTDTGSEGHPVLQE